MINYDSCQVNECLLLTVSLDQVPILSTPRSPSSPTRYPSFLPHPTIP